MALPGQVTAYGRVVEMLTQYPETFDYDRDQVWVSLHNSTYTPNTSHSYDSDLRGEVSGGNYARRKLQGREVLFDEATQRIQLKATRIVWPLLTTQARWAVIRFSAVTNAPNLIGWVDLGGNRQVFNSTFAIGWENDMILEIEGVPSVG